MRVTREREGKREKRRRKTGGNGRDGAGRGGHEVRADERGMHTY